MKEQHKAICERLNETYAKKNHDYGDSFGKLYDEFGFISALVRIGDKFNRLVSLSTKENKVTDESTKDTLLDMANYCIMTVMQMEKRSQIEVDLKPTKAKDVSCRNSMISYDGWYCKNGMSKCIPITCSYFEEE